MTKKLTVGVMPSMPFFLSALKEGETFSRSKRVPVGSDAATQLNALVSKLRNQVAVATAKVRKAMPDVSFRVESGVSLTDDRTAHLVTVAVTRAGEEVEGDDDDNLAADEDDGDDI